MDEDKQVLKTVQEYPSNSHKSKDAPPVKKVERIVTTTVTRQKQSLFKSFLGWFDMQTVGSYLLHDILIPAAKDTVEDVFKGGIEILLRGERGGRYGRDRGRNDRDRPSYKEYDKRYDDRRPTSRDEGYERSVSSRGRSTFNFDEIKITDRREADRVLDQLMLLTEDYGEATVADFYQMVGVRDEHTDQNYGWTILRGCRVVPVRGGYIIDLPKPRPLGR